MRFALALILLTACAPKQIPLGPEWAEWEREAKQRKGNLTAQMSGVNAVAGMPERIW